MPLYTNKYTHPLSTKPHAHSVSACLGQGNGVAVLVEVVEKSLVILVKTEGRLAPEARCGVSVFQFHLQFPFLQSQCFLGQYK